MRLTNDDQKETTMAYWSGEPPSDEQRAGYDEWVESRPEPVKSIAKRLNPWTLYRLKTTTHRVTLAAISEDGTVRVNVSADFNMLAFERSVFGINPDDLEECDLPAADEPFGAALTQDQVDANIDRLREMAGITVKDGRTP
jgi:hypothetical protein